ncbi:hypothetical protein SAMN05421833_101521 [Microbispora rosea]|uniref:Uncharacterized protein n=1 Tax=Microbispora rosea TaxID=58117 RepID=A0A1N6RW47_9ACTN|nr:hypothetical protein SAMN05421833_101521 [Microbispora rosea]
MQVTAGSAGEPLHRGTARQSLTMLAYVVAEALWTSGSVIRTSTPRAARVVRWLLLQALPPLKCGWKPLQSTGTPRDLKSLTML